LILIVIILNGILRHIKFLYNINDSLNVCALMADTAENNSYGLGCIATIKLLLQVYPE